jgi:hypothetical protein
MPWSGFFALLDQSDIVVLLDSVAFSKQSWQQRNRIRTDKGLEYLTVPVKTAGRFGQRINAVEIMGNDFILFIDSKITLHYQKSRFFQDYYTPIIEVLRTSVMERNLGLLNVSIIRFFNEILGIKTPLFLSSSLNIEADRSNRLTDICEHYSCTSYLSPQGSREYLLDDREIFEKRGINVFLQRFEHPIYTQQYDPFIPFASLLDLLFNEGPQSLDIIRSGINSPESLIVC